MMRQPVFQGLVFDEEGNPAEVRWVGGEPCYVVYDPWGMAYHIPSEQVDRQVLERMYRLMEGHEEVLAQAAARFLGQEDPFTLAALQEQFRHLDEHMEALLQVGLPEDARYLLGMMGFRVVINHHGEVVEVHFPHEPMEPEEGDEDL